MERRERAVKGFLLTWVACWIMGGAPAAAQVVLDGSLGPSGQLPGPDVTIPAAVGTRAGPNLFHSFQTFSIHQGESATFTGPTGLANVISRVTGGEVSTIDGVLSSQIPNADFWFLNPAGVVFGLNARLDVPASFHLSTADELRFADGERFSATTPGATVLTVAPPEAFGFLRANPAKIEVNESRLETEPGQVLSLVGGDISIKGGDEGEIRAEGGQINLSALAGPGEVAIPDGKPSGAAGGAITLEDQALVDVSGNGGGTVRIRGGQFIVQGSAVFADNTGELDAAGGIDVQADKVDMRQGSTLTADVLGSGKGGNITLDVGRLELRDGARVVAATFGAGDAGNLTVNADEVVATGVSRSGDFPSGLFASSQSKEPDAGKGGDIALTVGRLELSGRSQVAATTFGPGDAGSITLDVDRLELSGDSQVQAATVGSGDAGSLRVTADEVVATGRSEGIPSGLFASSVSEGVDAGKGGDIALTVGRLELHDGAQVSAETSGPGDAGSLRVTADEVVATGRSEGIPSGLFATTLSGNVDAGKGGSITLTVGRLELRDGAIVATATVGPGDAGSITLTVGRLELRDGARVVAATFGPGDAGSLRVTADEIVATGSSEGYSGLFANSRGTGTDAGKGGDIALTVGRLELSGGGWVSAATSGPGDAGDIVIDVGQLELSGGGWLEAATFGPGDAGNIALTVAGRLELRDGGQVEVATFGPGGAGSLTVRSNEIVATGSGSGLLANSLGTGTNAGKGGDIALEADVLRMSDNASITAETARADAGDIVIEVEELIDLEDSAITTSAAGGEGAGGNIDIDPRFLVLDNSRIVANATEGAGGNIDIAADFIFRSPDSVIDASSAFGISGTVDITATDIDVTSGVVALPAAFLNPAALRARCGGRPTGGTGTFTGIGRGGTGLTPDAPLPGVYSDLIEPTRSAATSAAPAAPPPAGSDTPMFASNIWLTSCHTE